MLITVIEGRERKARKRERGGENKKPYWERRKAARGKQLKKRRAIGREGGTETGTRTDEGRG